MKKKCLHALLLTLLLAVIPVAAHAWTLTLKVTGGSLTQANTVVLSGGAVKTVASGNVTVYPSTATTVTVNTAPGSTSQVTLDGMAAPSSFSLSSGSHTVTVSYAAPTASTLSITSSAGGAFYVLLPNNTWTSSGASGLVTGTTLQYSIAADASHVISAYTLPGASGTGNGSKGQAITGSFILGSGNNALTANFGFAATVTGSLSAPTNGFTSQPVNCTATASSNDTGLLYAFNVTGPANFSQAASPAQTFKFTPTLQGTYAVTATVTSANGGSFTSETAKVIVTNYQANLNSQCISCHSTQSPTIVSDYQASVLHTQSPSSTCGSCHSPDAPHSAGINAANVDPVTFQVKTDSIAGATLGASFCIKCHDTTIDDSFNASKHKTSSLTCSSCHTKGVHNVDFTTTPVRPFAGDSYLNRDLGRSNICMTCHSGANSGTSIAGKVATANFGNLPFVAPSDASAGGTLHGKVGYHFPGQTYAFYSSNSHRSVGMGNQVGTGTGGPCVACHMTSAAKHSYQAAALDGSGAVTAISSSSCANCHAASLGVVQLAADQTAYLNALNVLKAMLADKGFVYSTVSPHFSNTNWGAGQAGANVMGAAFNYALLAEEPGAYAHNGAYAKKLILDSIDTLYNGSITGSIDSALAYLVQKGEITQAVSDGMTAYKAANSCTSCHANNSGSHTKHLSSSVSCAQCHSLTAAGSSSLVSGTSKHLNGLNDVNFSAGGSYGAGSCSNVYCHSNGAAVFSAPSWGSGALNCSSCHPISSLGGAHAAHIGNVIPTFYGETADNSTAAEYRFGCANCHPTALSSHGDGHVDLTLVPTSDGSLRSKNSPSVLVGGIGNTNSGITGNSRTSVVCSAAYCHSNGAVGAALAFVASPDWYGSFSGDKCAMCHGNVPASGAHAKHAVSIHTGQITGPDGLLTQGHGDSVPATIINCDLCHNTTVTSSNNDKGSACASCHASNAKGTPTLDKTRHLNGSVEVAFRDVKVVTKAQIRPASFASYSGVWTRTSYKVDTGSYDSAKLSLNQAVFAGDKSCANVACHNGKTPKWSDKLTCVSCHSQL